MTEMDKNQYADKHRPNTLDEMIGQDGVKLQVKGMLKTGKIPNTILISGPTGAGKTTLAAIIANLVNGLSPNEINPDFMDYNLGDRTGVADARDIIRVARFMPRHKFRVILLDEFHLASRQAMSALLKPLESPPKKTIWIICSDQPDRILPTALKRALRLPLELPTPDECYVLLKRIAKIERIQFGDRDEHRKMLHRIANTAMGEPRNALQFLQSAGNAMEGGANPKTALRSAMATLGAIGNDSVAIKLLLCLYKGNSVRVLRTLADVNGRDYVGLVNLLLDFNSFLICNATETPTYVSPARRKLAEYLPNLPEIGRLVAVHDGLVSIKQQMANYAVAENHLLTARLGTLAVTLTPPHSKQ